jgi:subtilisin
MAERGQLKTHLEAVPEMLLEPAALGRGAGVRVAILDTGIDAGHPDLVAPVTRCVRVATGPRGTPVVVPDEPGDPAGHGTACADIVGALAPEVELWSVRVLGPSTRGSSAALLAALEWAVNEGAQVINLSLGTREPAMAAPLRDLVDAAYRKSLLVVASANNVPGVKSYPAVFTSLVCVDAEYLPDREAFLFRTGDMSELVAPGVYVDAAWPGGGRKLVTGTSFACPHISGHIARLLSANPGLAPFQVKTLLYAMGKRNQERAQLARTS